MERFFINAVCLTKGVICIRLKKRIPTSLPSKIRVLLVLKLFIWTSAFLCIPLVMLYMTDQGFGVLIAATTLAFGFLAGCFGGFIGGYLSDRFGRATVLHVTLLLWGITFFGLAFAQTLVHFVCLTLLNGLLRGFFDSIVYTLVGDLCSNRDESLTHKAMDLAYAMMNAGIGLGSAAGVWLYHQLPFSSVLIATGAVITLAGLITLRMHRSLSIPQEEEEPTLRKVICTAVQDRRLLVALGMAILLCLGFSQFETTLPIHLQQYMLLWMYPVLQAINAIGVSLFIFLRLTEKSRKWFPTFQSLVKVSVLLFFVGYASLGSHSVVILIVGMALLTIGEALFLPRWKEYIRQMGARKGMPGTYMGASGLIQIGYFIGPLAGGWILESFGGMVLFLTVAVMALMMVPMLALNQPKLRKSEQVA
ncbi:MFS transporter [Desmospora activa]|uniref:Putative MFS family arabinose efflux permease n=1 Tax=Desmospora activa DSM 45169 TaxID=1121389 RepID=A0A2T4YZV6_9BACL|nr:MFS transporter [Desmospora activa]PTM52695.1 putative MFS family arabinose efflux permease [Desmospora activa DSM 45169]